MNMNYELIILLLSISWFVTHFTPLTTLLFSIESTNPIIQRIINLLTCWKCCSLWLSIPVCLILGQPIYIPLIVSMLGYILEKNY